MTLSSDTDHATEESSAPMRPAAGTEEHRRPSDAVNAEMPDSDDQIMDSLRSHVPITLLMDLLNPEGPHSAEIAQAEGGDADWLGAGEHAD